MAIKLKNFVRCVSRSVSGDAVRVRTVTGLLGDGTYVGCVDDVGVHVEFDGAFAF